VYKILSNYLTEITKTKIEVKPTGVSIANASRVEKIKPLLKLLVKKWYEKKHPTKKNIEEIIKKVDEKLIGVRNQEIRELLKYFRGLMIRYIV